MPNMYANNCMFIGRLTSDPELTKGEVADRVNFTLALNPPGKDEGMYLRCVAWNEMAHKIVSSCHRGCEISVQGELDISTYNDRKYPDMKRTGVSLKISSFSVGSLPGRNKAAVKMPDPPI